MQPYEPAEGQLLTLQLRLLRAARAFLDPELQSGAVTEAQAYAVLEKDVMLSHAFAKEEVERFTFRSPGTSQQLFLRLHAPARRCARKPRRPWARNSTQKKFHDFILGQGLLPPDLMRSGGARGFHPVAALASHDGGA